METQPDRLDVVILCGGLGTRLREVVSDRPKPMALVNGRPFLEILIDQFQPAGFRRFILCTGHLSDAVRRHFSTWPGVDIVISEEQNPLGTAGALKHAESRIRSDPFLVTNGDSFCKVDLQAFCRFHRACGALLSMVLSPCEDTGDYGCVEIDGGNRITGFAEKGPADRAGLINAGVYLFGRRVLDEIPAGQALSLEHEVFPALIQRPCFGFLEMNPVLDIGTPERLRQARAQLSSLA